MKRVGISVLIISLLFFLFLYVFYEMPLLPAQFDEFFQDSETGEWTGLIFLISAFGLSFLGLLLSLKKPLKGFILILVGAVAVMTGDILLKTYYKNLNEFLFLFLTIGMVYAAFVIMASGLKGNRRKIQMYVVAYSFLLVPLVLMGIFTFYPLFKGVTLSFAKYNIINGKTEWLGFENYKSIFDDGYFYRALSNTYKYLIIVIPIQFFSLSLAVLVNKKLRGMKFFRTLFYIPVITGAVIVSLTWKWIYAEDGLLNYMLMTLNLIEDPILWLTDKRFALGAAMFVTLWRGLGYYMIIYLAGLQNISGELYEAADIDGASGSKKFFKITLPLMRPTILLCSVLSTMAAFKVFEEIFLLTGGGSNTSTLAYEIYDRAFVRYNFGESSAMAIVLSAMVAVFTIINFKFFGAGKKEARAWQKIQRN
ncbi:MAG: carbohydrate ABC transporter permease [Thermotogota bacterium]